MDEKLIDLVRAHEELYNLADKRYSDNIHKNRLWREFDKELKKGPDYCKKRWQSLRSQFRKVCRFRSTKTGQAAKSNKIWKYDDELSFLLPYMKDKARLTSTDVNLSSENSQESTDEDQTFENSQAFEAENTEETRSIPHQTATPKVDVSRKRKCVKNTEKRDNSPVSGATETTLLMKYILDQKTADESQPKDALDHFFDGIKASVKAFSPQDKHIAKTKIFSVVSEIEAKYVNIGNNIKLDT